MRLLYSLLLSTFSWMAFGQMLQEKCKLPSSINEASGIEWMDGNTYLMHNDGGNANEIFVVDSNCQIIRTITVVNMPNIDWEDLTLSNNGTLFIGDIGNNNNTRKDLRIGIIEYSDWFNQDTVEASFIHFSYASQSAFPPPNAQKIYDCEAMVWHNDSLFLFSKNWTQPYTGFTHLYGMPAASGTYAVRALDSFKTGSISVTSFITSADALGDQFALLSSSDVWIFDFDNALRFNGSPTNRSLNDFSQKEALCYQSPTRLAITDESAGNKGYRYEFDFGTSSLAKKVQNQSIKIDFNNNLIRVTTNQLLPPIVEIRLYNEMGMVLQIDKTPQRSNEFEFILKSPIPNQQIILFDILLANGQHLRQKRLLPNP
jgi:hypothetical protein